MPQMVVAAPPGQGLQQAATRPAAPAEDARTRDWYRGLRPRRRRRARGHRLRARLARHDRLPGHAAARRARLVNAALRRRRALEAAQRHDLHRGRRLGLGARRADGAAAALHRGRQGARVHAQRDPLRLDGQQHPPRPRVSRRVGGKPSSSRRRSTAAGRCTTSAGSTARKQHLARSSTSGATRSGAGSGIAAHHGYPQPKADAYLYIGRPATPAARATAARSRSARGGRERALMFAKNSTDLASAPAWVSLRLAQGP